MFYSRRFAVSFIEVLVLLAVVAELISAAQKQHRKIPPSRCEGIKEKLASSTDTKQQRRLTKKLEECEGIRQKKCKKWKQLLESSNLNKLRRERLEEKVKVRCIPANESGLEYCTEPLYDDVTYGQFWQINASTTGLPDWWESISWAPDFEFFFCLPKAGNVTVSLCSYANFDAHIAIDEYIEEDDSYKVWCMNDDFCGDRPQMDCTLPAGSYSALVSSFFDDEHGDFTLQVTCAECACVESPYNDADCDECDNEDET